MWSDIDICNILCKYRCWNLMLLFISGQCVTICLMFKYFMIILVSCVMFGLKTFDASLDSLISSWLAAQESFWFATIFLILLLTATCHFQNASPATHGYGLMQHILCSRIISIWKRNPDKIKRFHDPPTLYRKRLISKVSLLLSNIVAQPHPCLFHLRLVVQKKRNNHND